jgi:DNA-binding NarL/FixJ family response regulator
MSGPIRVIIVDDHALVRAGFSSLLKNLTGIKVVGEASEGYEALRLIKEKNPDIVLLDISMPGINGLEVADRIRKEFPEVRVIILSMYLNEEYVLQAMRVGAAGYLMKDSKSEELELAIKAVADGRKYLSSPVSKKVIEAYIKQPLKSGPMVNRTGVYERLTPRQREVVQLITEGHTTKEIAKKLNVSIKTIDAHRTQIMDRLDIHDVASLVRYAIQMGIVKLD